MKSYLDILQKILDEGTWKKNRTGIDTISITGHMFEHDLRLGFPLLTTKKMYHKAIRVELEGFIKGVTSKEWYQERDCRIWDGWCNPKKVPYGNDEETKNKMKSEDDLGPIYGFQWRAFGADYWASPHVKYGQYSKAYKQIIQPGWYPDGASFVQSPNTGIDQLKNVIEKLKTNPFDRRMIVMAWNPEALDQQALPPCHYGFQVLSDGENVDLLWNQRSVDTPLGLGFNIASYALLLTLIGKECNLIPRKLIGFLADVHIYRDQMDGVMEQLKREPLPLPTIEIPNFTSIFDWTYDDFELKNYQSHEKISFPVAV